MNQSKFSERVASLYSVVTMIDHYDRELYSYQEQVTVLLQTTGIISNTPYLMQYDVLRKY